VGPVVSKLVEALQSSTQVRCSASSLSSSVTRFNIRKVPEDARNSAILQLQTLTGVAKGLTRMADPIIVLEESDDDEAQAARMRSAYEDPRMIGLRTSIFTAMRGTVDLWSMDASVSDVRDFILDLCAH
jgi:hypothetical protein